MRKSRYDVGARAKSQRDEAHRRMAEIEKEKPETYTEDPEWKQLRDEARMAGMRMASYEKARDRGAKF